MKKMKVSIIGAGAMGSAIAAGLLGNRGNGYTVAVSNPSADKLKPLASMGAQTCTSNPICTFGADIIIIAVKPWILPLVIRELTEADAIPASCREICCVVAGVSSDDLLDMFGGNLSCALTIAMPNTAMTVGQSMTFLVEICGTAQLSTEIFSHLGMVRTIEERQLPGATALASCGIAYALRYIRAAAEGGVELGFRASDATDIVVQTILGAAEILRRTGAHPEAEIDKVTTPGGLTIRGLNAMERAGFTSAVIEGLKASTK